MPTCNDLMTHVGCVQSCSEAPGRLQSMTSSIAGKPYGAATSELPWGHGLPWRTLPIPAITDDGMLPGPATDDAISEGAHAASSSAAFSGPSLEMLPHAGACDDHALHDDVLQGCHDAIRRLQPFISTIAGELMGQLRLNDPMAGPHLV